MKGLCLVPTLKVPEFFHLCKDGKIQELLGWEQDKDPSPIAQGILDVLDGPTRIDSPMIRKSWLEGGPGTNNKLRGSDPFCRS